VGLTFASLILSPYWVKPAGVPKLIGVPQEFFFLDHFP
jgi:hypothetical protein